MLYKIAILYNIALCNTLGLVPVPVRPQTVEGREIVADGWAEPVL